jgi:hypothetical protein
MIDWASVVKALEGKDLNKPIPTYEFTGSTKYQPVNYNPYTGSSS